MGDTESVGTECHDRGVDESWLRESRELERSRSPTVKAVFLYVGENGDLNGVCTERATLDGENTVTSDRLCAMIERRKTWNGMRFVFQELARFAIADSAADLIALDDACVVPARDESHLRDVRFADAHPTMLDLSTLFFVMRSPARGRFTRGRRPPRVACTRRHCVGKAA